MKVTPVLLVFVTLVAACAKENGITIETPNGSIHMSLPEALPQQPQAPAAPQASTASPVPATPATVAPPAPVATATSSAPVAVTPPAPTPPAATSAPATSPEGFKAKVEAKCLAKHPEGKLRYKTCVALRMGAVRAACKLATGKNPEALCKEHPNYCTPEVQEMVYEGLSFCDTFTKEKEE